MVKPVLCYCYAMGGGTCGVCARKTYAIGRNCKAHQVSDQMACPCGNGWDMNDVQPPECKDMKTPIYTIGNGKHTQIARRAADGTWFIRQCGLTGRWGPWRACAKRPYEFSAFIDPKAGSARLPDVGKEDHAPSSAT